MVADLSNPEIVIDCVILTQRFVQQLARHVPHRGILPPDGPADIEDSDTEVLGRIGDANLIGNRTIQPQRLFQQLERVLVGFTLIVDDTQLIERVGLAEQGRAGTAHR